ncbi:MAG: DUF3857 domain-containing protein [Planctomycetota bacterium]
MLNRTPAFIRFVLFLMLCSGCVVFGEASQNPQVSLQPIPEWVQLMEWNPKVDHPGETASAGVRYLLYEQQKHPELKESFIHVAMFMQTESGVQDSGNLQVIFNPAYEKLFFHKICIHRDGQTIDKLDLSSLQVIQPETEQNIQLFTGKKTALLFVEDLRIGDVLEYAYTLRGENPATAERFFTSFQTQHGVDVERQRFRVLWPNDNAKLHIRSSNTNVLPQLTRVEGLVDYKWDFENQSAISYEDFVPASYEFYPYVEMSDYENWTAVVNWALPLYQPEPEPLPVDLDTLIKGWMLETKIPQARALKALEFVQDEIRYTSIAMGESAFRPAHPFETFRMRYGDCKGKSVLLCVMLREMGFVAHPALVASGLRQTIASHLPNPHLFDHVIVKMILDNKPVWVDPTMSHQGGDIHNRYLAELAKALVIKEGVADLENVPSVATRSEQYVTTTFELDDYESPSAMTVFSVCTGWEADNLRKHFARTDLQKVSKNYLNYFARFYSGIEQLHPIRIKDDRIANRITTTESYRINNLWLRDDDQMRWEAGFVADNLFEILPEPKVRVRTAPFSLPYPLCREQNIVIYLPDSEWDIPARSRNIDNSAFSFSFHRQLEGNKLTLQQQCETKAAILPAEEVEAYLLDQDELQDLIYCSLFRNDEQTDGAGSAEFVVNGLMVALALFAAIITGIICFGIWILGKKLPARVGKETSVWLDSSPQGLGGWLVLVAIGLCIGLLMQIVSIVQGWEGYFSLRVWQNVAMPGGSGYHPLWGVSLTSELLGGIGLFGLNALLIIMFFAKHRAFPPTYILIRVFALVVAFTSYVLLNQIPEMAEEVDPGDIVRETISAAIWCSYMLRSRRVKATFIN